jgi:coenzyme F420-0:L-glutamate ligase/coenzyme F420-1:gamma-L-glutamate ligase
MSLCWEVDMKKVEVIRLGTVPEIKPGDKLGEIIVNCAKDEAGNIKEKDIIVVTSKIVSKAGNTVTTLSKIQPGDKAIKLSSQADKAVYKIQLIMDSGQETIAVIPLAALAEEYIMKSTARPDEARQLLAKEGSILITKDNEGRLHTYDGGIDSSSHPDDVISLPPSDPDRSAREIRQEIKKLTDKEVAVIIADTEMVPFGSMDLAIGSSGIEPITKRFAEPDRFGRPKFGE